MNHKLIPSTSTGTGLAILLHDRNRKLFRLQSTSTTRQQRDDTVDRAICAIAVLLYFAVAVFLIVSIVHHEARLFDAPIETITTSQHEFVDFQVIPTDWD